MLFQNMLAQKSLYWNDYAANNPQLTLHPFRVDTKLNFRKNFIHFAVLCASLDFATYLDHFVPPDKNTFKRIQLEATKTISLVSAKRISVSRKYYLLTLQHYLSSCSRTSETFPHYPYGSESNFPYQSGFTQMPSHNDVSLDSIPGLSSKYFETSTEFLKDILDKLVDKETYVFGIEKLGAGSVTQKVSTCVETQHDPSICLYSKNSKDDEDDDNDIDVLTPYTNTSTDCKKKSILSRFYKADGTPIKNLWDNNDTSAKEEKTYKYDPKPLERRKNPRNFVPDDKKTKEYWERRRKNNMAARKSREDRRKKEIEILKIVDNLKNDNFRLKICAQKVMTENQSLKYELEVLKRF
ncbi:transcription factor VBP-like [Hydractinia symbiolongicarpus]|uniref:transcription factor VBP-like n=1 Tax=Hydractinia symbiolongicarpus TaxID=13093 RepID=UPI002549F9F1|nr:transcription factor VBP-like [Hydractinia symbiolongicarpus]